MPIESVAMPRLKGASEGPTPPAPELPEPQGGAWEALVWALRPIASLKLTIVLMLLSIFIVLAGTFAQVDHDIWKAINTYFRVDPYRAFPARFPFVNWQELFVQINPEIFFPASFFPAEPTFPPGLEWLKPYWPSGRPDFPDWTIFWFPRGWTIGIVMMANLLAAHLIRFKIQSRGARLWSGLGVLALGLFVTWAVIDSGANSDGPQNQPLISYGSLWKLMQFSLFALTAASLAGLSTIWNEKRHLRWPLAAAATMLFGLSVGSLALQTPSPSAMRIVYQLLKGLVAAGVLLAGCQLLFKRRAGVVLLHGGIGLLMAYEVLVGVAHVESQMLIFEGEETNYSQDIRTTELAFVTGAGNGEERHIVLRADALQKQKRMTDPRLPCDVELIDWFPNAEFQPLQPNEKPVATTGIAARAGQKLVGLRASSGTDNGPVDAPGANVRLIDRQTGQTIGVLALWSRLERGQPVHIGQQDFDVALRFQRHYKPYSIYLYDIQQNNYSGTSRARDFRAIIKLTDNSGNVALDRYPIWMNNPLRYGGETFYQSEIKAAKDGDRIVEATQLQVVKNEGWMAPYVACMIVAVGMCYTFLGTLLRFLDRLSRDAPRQTEAVLKRASFGALHLAAVYGLPLLGASVLGYFALLKPPVVEGFHIGEFGELPVVSGGRAMPLDTLARNRLMLISDRQTFKPHDPDPDDFKSPPSLPAIYWLLEMAARPEEANHLPVFRIENDELTRSLGMEVALHRAYSFHDFEQHRDRLFELAKAAIAVPPEKQTVLQRKQVDLFKRIQAYNEVQDWFMNIWQQLGEVRPELTKPDAPPPLRMQAAQLLAQMLQRMRQDPARAQTPLLIPTQLQAPERSVAASQQYAWEPFQVAAGHYGLENLIGGQHSPAMVKFLAILDAWKARDAAAFNAAVDDYKALLAAAKPAELTQGLANVQFGATGFEEYFNRFSPFNALSWVYLGVLLATLVGWMLAGAGQMEASRFAHRSGMWLAVVLLIVHTWAIGARIYISGKPPVTNLYSSAVFIGWAAVLAGILFEKIFGRGFGNIISAASGFMTLRIAYGLMSDGDTLGVLEPVLDTTFWLATHVVCITLGYAATYVTGLLGLLYILRGSRLGLFTLALLLAPVGALLIGSGESATVAGGWACLAGAAASLVVGGLTLSGKFDVRFDDTLRRTLVRMIYGTLCAATLLSFVGTVLGGLWADDSWGRFWGWDPKENGALIIVMWNALILHASWDRLIKDHGLAVLAVLGNIVVTWSWFGVNMLGVGLHAYGFTEGRLFWLLLFGLSQVVLAIVGIMPGPLWWNRRPVELEFVTESE